ncbi:MAG TPA: hypothetical protein V6C71_01455 [Coleofasciculaceae cyanobacterium]
MRTSSQSNFSLSDRHYSLHSFEIAHLLNPDTNFSPSSDATAIYLSSLLSVLSIAFL